MLTLDEAKALTRGRILYHVYQRNADGSPARWRVNGKVKLWKRSPDRVEVPLKHGMYAYDYLDETCLNDLCLTEAEALAD